MQQLPLDIQIPFKKQRFRSSNILPLFLLAMFFIQVLLLLLVFFNGVQISKIANRPAPALVQLIDGQVLKVAPAAANHRESVVIDRLVREWATLTMNWSGRFPNGEPDPGVDVGNGKAPSSAWVASFVLSEDFRGGFIKQIAQMVPTGVFEGRTQTVLQIEHISWPQLLSPGQWQVNIVANLLTIDLAKPIGQPIEFNKQIFLQAVPPPLYPLSDGGSELQKAVYKLRQAGLEIFQIEDLES